MPPRPYGLRSYPGPDDEFARYPRRSWLLADYGYRKEVTELVDGQFYWHVFWHGERINGGLSGNWQDAHDDAVRAARQDHIHRDRLLW